MSGVSVVKCESYDLDEVLNSIDKTFENLGGLKKYINPGDRVFLKLNLVMKKHPEEAATSHPVVVEAVAKRLIEAGAEVIIGDSPGGPYNPGILKGLYRVCGIEKAAEKAGAKLNYDCSSQEYHHPEGVSVKRLTLIKPMMECDKIVTISKLKTHGMTLFTGAVKVMFGSIPGVLKAEYHYKMPNVKNFTNMLVDICTLTKPALSIIDGIYGMEGDGPTAGTPVHLGTILASENPCEADVVGAYIMGMNPLDVPTIKRCRERKILSGDINDVKVIGEDIEKLRINCRVPEIRTINFSGKLPKFIEGFLNRNILPRPMFSQAICIGCGNCKQCCPPGAIEMVDGRPVVDLNKCIRCFCCQELCPMKAVEIKRSWILRKFLG